MVPLDPRTAGRIEERRADDPGGPGVASAREAATVSLAALQDAARRARRARAESHPPLAEVERAVARARTHLLEAQRPDGRWVDALEGDSILESETLLLLRFLGVGDEARLRGLGERLRRTRRPRGGWGTHPGARADVSASVKAYLALRLLGDSPAAPHMAQAREVILDLGGLDAVNSFTRIALALHGVVPWALCPAIPPELVLLPARSPLGLASMSSWSRQMVVPLSVIWAHRPVQPLPPGLGLDELRAPRPPRRASPEGLQARTWRAVFLGLDRAVKRLERGPRPLRRRALARAERWMLERMDHSDGLGAIFPPIVFSIVALRCLGYGVDHPRVRAQLEELEKLQVEEDGALRVQPCVGAVWDTALALHALAETGSTGTPPDARLGLAARWLLEREVRRPGDWRARAPGAEPGGWAFEDRNPFYPDCDDTAQVLTALGALRAAGVEEPAAGEARRRAVAWLLAMQNDDGGWGAFDRGCDRRVLTYVPFADHNAMLDPSSEDITGRVIEALVGEGLSTGHRAIRRAGAFLRARQDADGAWYGRWGANYLYGTFLALRGLRLAGEDPASPRCQAAAAWIRRSQNDDGGWGEALESYDHPGLKGRGETTAAQTAWAVLGLMEAGDRASEALRAGVERLLALQDARGGWLDRPWTGTGFPRVFYLRYALYDDHFPLLALGRYLARRRADREREES